MIGDRKRGPDNLVFVSASGGEWHGRNCRAKEFPAYRDAAVIPAETRAGFQWLRHTFVDVGKEAGDRTAIKISVGHAERDITENYIHAGYDPRQEALSRYVELWLIGGGK